MIKRHWKRTTTASRLDHITRTISTTQLFTCIIRMGRLHKYTKTGGCSFAMEDVDLILRKCIARFNLLHRTLDNHNETKAVRVCPGDGQCRSWRRCSFNTSMTTWPRLRGSALGMDSAAVISNALDHLKEVVDKLQTSATSCEPRSAAQSCYEVPTSYSILEQGILWTFSNTHSISSRWWWKTSNTHSISSRYWWQIANSRRSRRRCLSPAPAQVKVIEMWLYCHYFLWRETR